MNIPLELIEVERFILTYVDATHNPHLQRERDKALLALSRVRGSFWEANDEMQKQVAESNRIETQKKLAISMIE